MDPHLSSILATVGSFAAAAGTRDLAALERALAPDAVQHVRVGGRWSALPTAVYLQLVRDGKIGGEPVSLEVAAVTRFDGVATVRATRRTPTLRLDDVYTLTAADTTWTIAAAAVIATPVTA